MRTLRNAFLTLGILLASSLVAQQQYFVNISGHHTPCDPTIQNSYVYIESLPGVIPEIGIDVPVNENCYYSVTLEVNSAEYGFQIWSACANNITAVVGDTAWNVPPGITIAVVQDFDCSNQPLDCLDIPGGPNLPYMPCDDGDPDTNLDLWDDNCNCVGYNICEACFTWEQATDAGAIVPFTVDLTNCTVELIPPYTYYWLFPDGTTTTTTGPTYTFPGPGQYYITLYASGDSCNSSISRMISASPDGTLSTFPPAGCTACFSALQNTVLGQPVPFNAILDNCSYGDQPVQYLWTLPDGTTSTLMDDVLYTFPGAGTYVICLSIADNDGCNSTFCDSIFVDADGNITLDGNPPVDCLGIPNGPNIPGTACNEPATGVLGTWSANCECLPNVGLPCEAGFWVMQAYTNGDSLNNPNGGGAVPIPFELWVWNLSTGGTGNYQFVWDFGDGTSSTEAFPTHVYPASGPYTLCLTVTDGAGCEDTYCEDIEVDQDGILGMGTGFDVRSVLTIRVIQELPTGIDEGAALEATKLWPNPVAEQFDLTLNSSRSGNITLTIVDLNGREVRITNVSVLAGNNQLPMDVSGLESGMYVLRLTNGNNSAAMRFVKQ